MVVGEDVAIGAHDDARSERAFDALPGYAEGDRHQRIVEQAAVRSHAPLRVDVDDRRRGCGDGAAVAAGVTGRCLAAVADGCRELLQEQQPGEGAGNDGPADECQGSSHGFGKSRASFHCI